MSLASHADVNGVQTCCKHFDNHLIGVGDDGEAGIFGKSQNIIASIFINDPCGHDTFTAAGGLEKS